MMEIFSSPAILDMPRDLLSPLLRLLAGLGAGLLLANLLEALRWTDVLARLTGPLSRLAHLGNVASPAFALAFVSPAAANGLLSENFARGAISRRELVLANLFNGLPSYLVHTPTIFFLTWPALGIYALVYVGLTFLAALGRMIFTIILSRFLLPVPENAAAPLHLKNMNEGGPEFRKRLRAALASAWKRFRKRFPRIIYYTIPFYVLMYLCQKLGFFSLAEEWLAARLDWLAFIKPQAMGIVILQLAAEMGATLGAAGAALADGGLGGKDIVLALLAGNVLSTPMRALRHQLPAYAGYYKPRLALELIAANQSFRAVSMIIVIAAYALVN